MKKYYLQVYRHTLSTGEDETWININKLELHPDILQQIAELGIVDLRNGLIPARQIKRIQKLMRLRRDLGINFPGVAVILDLLERVEALEDELDRLKRR